MTITSFGVHFMVPSRHLAVRRVHNRPSRMHYCTCTMTEGYLGIEVLWWRVGVTYRPADRICAQHRVTP